MVKYKDRLLVNPGSITRQTADQAEHKPRVYLWFAETNSVTAEYLPIKTDVITKEHLEIKAERDMRMEAFISRPEGGLECVIVIRGQSKGISFNLIN